MPGAEAERRTLRLGHAVALVFMMALLAAVHLAAGVEASLVWFLPVWFLVLGFERLWAMRRRKERSWQWLVLSFASHLQFMVVCSSIVSHVAFPHPDARHRGISLPRAAFILGQVAAACVWLRSQRPAYQLLWGLAVAGLCGAGLATDLTGCRPLWAWCELGLVVFTTLVLFTGGLMGL